MSTSHSHRPERAASSDERPLILFDGVCNLCNRAVDFVIAHDPKGRFRFGSLQSEAARPHLARCAERGVPEADLDPEGQPASIVLVEEDTCYTRSTAALRIARRLETPWPLLYGAILVPRFLRDAVYDWIARNRYGRFGRRETCRLPTPELAERFLEDPSPEPTSGPSTDR